MEELLFYSELIEDYERVVGHHMQRGDYEAVLKVLCMKEVRPRLASSPQIKKEQAEELFYKLSPTLMQHVPAQTVKAWRKCQKFLDPAKLIPSLVRYSHQRLAQAGAGAGSGGGDGENFAMSYLDYIVRRGRVKNPAIYNYLLSLYAEQVRGRSLSLSLSFSLSLSLSLSHSLTHSLTHSPTHPPTHSLTLSLSLTHSLFSLSHTRTLTPAVTLPPRDPR
jgi:hypothetical protein